MRFSAYRLRHLPTVCSCTPTRSVPPPLGDLSVQSRTILHRSDSGLGAKRVKEPALLVAQRHFHRLLSHRTGSRRSRLPR